jgi:HD-like signal output (HDOD) protein
MSGLTPLTEKVNAALAELSNEIRANTLQLPSPPDNILHLRKLIQSDSGVDEVASHLKKDPHLSARLLKVANSALFARRSHVTDVKAAIVRLGLSKVQNLVTGFAITQQFVNRKTLGIETQLRKSWSKANRVAAICSILAREKTAIDPDTALLAGQLHNIGESPLLIRINSMPELRENLQLKHTIINIVLKRLAAKVGAAILKKWHFPAEITQLPFVESAFATQPPVAAINLDTLLFTSLKLSDYDFTKPVTAMPEQFNNGPLFSLLWQDEDMAINDLNTFSDQIHETQLALSST